jgi:hypothetical protein
LKSRALDLAAGWGLGLGLIVLTACHTPDPQVALEVSDIETYWALDSARGATQYLAPVLRFKVKNKSAETLRSVQATCAFRRQGETETWGSDWKPVTASGHPLPPGATMLVVLKSDARYYSDGPPETMFQHAAFKDANVQLFLRVGPSGWSKFAEANIERRVGARSVQNTAGS